MFQKKEILRLQEELDNKIVHKDKHLTSCVTADACTQTANDGHGIKDSCDFIENHAVNGAIFNGTLLWMSIKRNMCPENKWKAIAAKKFLKEEITDAKESLWRACGEVLIKKKINRQGASKTVSEINDICIAMNTLAEKDSMPLFLATADMVMRTPLCEGKTEMDESGIAIKLANIEKTLDAVQTKLVAQDNRNMCTYEDKETKNQNDDSNLTYIPLLPSEKLDDTEAVNIVQRSDDTEDFNIQKANEDEWKKVQPRKVKKDWRKKLDIIHGTGSDETGGALSADLDLVAYGIRKDTTGIQVSQYLSNKGLDVKSCDLLTKFQGARTLAYKITIKRSDLTKASAPDMWPTGVGVRRFKYFNNQRRNTNSGRKKVTFSFSNQQRKTSDYVSTDHERSRIWNAPSKPLIEQSHRQFGAIQNRQQAKKSLYTPPNHAISHTVVPDNGLNEHVQPYGERQVKILNRSGKDNFYPVKTNIEPMQFGNIMNGMGLNTQDQSGYVSAPVALTESWSVGPHSVRFSENLIQQQYI